MMMMIVFDEKLLPKETLICNLIVAARSEGLRIRSMPRRNK